MKNSECNGCMHRNQAEDNFPCSKCVYLSRTDIRNYRRYGTVKTYSTDFVEKYAETQQEYFGR